MIMGELLIPLDCGAICEPFRTFRCVGGTYRTKDSKFYRGALEYFQRVFKSFPDMFKDYGYHFQNGTKARF